MEEKRNPVDVLHGLLSADTEYCQILRAQHNKILYLTEICREGIIGSEADWSKDHYMKLTEGLATILEETVDAFDAFEEALEDEEEKCQRTPEFQKWAREHYSESMLKALEEKGIFKIEENPEPENQPGRAIS